MDCFKCNSNVINYDYCYFVADLGPEISSILDQELPEEIPNDAVLCEACFISATSALENPFNGTEANLDSVKLEPELETSHERFVSVKLESEIEPEIVPEFETSDDRNVLVKFEPEFESLNGRNVCVWCLLSLTKRRAHLLANGPQRDIISVRIAPREIPEGGRVCHRCWTRASRLQGVIGKNPSQSQNICVCCRRSLSLRRSCPIPDGPERDVISARIAPREIEPGNQVCYACWMSARRNVQRANNANLNNEIRNNCTVCSISIFKRRTHLISHNLRDVVLRRIYPRQITNNSLVCDECWNWAQAAVQQENESVHPEFQEEQQQTFEVIPAPRRYVQLNNYKKIGTTSASCFVPGCTNSERHTVSAYLRKYILAEHKIYIAEHARVCLIHKTTYDWTYELNKELLSNVFSVDEIEKMLQINN